MGTRLTSEGVQRDIKAANEQWVLDSPVKVSNVISKLLTSNRCLSTVLAQDHFFSDFLSLHLTTKTHKESMMMLSGAGSKTSTSAHAADLMKRWSPPLSEWPSFFSGTCQQLTREASKSLGTCQLRHGLVNLPG